MGFVKGAKGIFMTISRLKKMQDQAVKNEPATGR
jgi:hypothetical protein